MSRMVDDVCAFVRRYTGDGNQTDAECIQFLETLSGYIDLRGEFDIDLEAVKAECGATP